MTVSKVCKRLKLESDYHPDCGSSDGSARISMQAELKGESMVDHSIPDLGGES